jgi:hypothetical protein
MDQGLALLAQGIVNGWVGVTKVTDSDAGQCVQILTSLIIPQPCTITAFESHRLTGVGWHDMVCHYLRL